MLVSRNARVFAVLLIAVLAGCSFFGKRARDHAMLPALRMSYQNVEKDAMAGVAALPDPEQGPAMAQVTAFSEAFTADPVPNEALTLWAPVAALCESGFVARLEAGTIGPGVAASLRERVALFGEGLVKYLGGGTL